MSNNTQHDLRPTISPTWEIIPLPIFVYDTDGRLIYVNRKCGEEFHIYLNAGISTNADMFRLKHITKVAVGDLFAPNESSKSLTIHVNPLTHTIIHHQQANAIEYQATVSKLYDTSNIINGYFVVLEEYSEPRYAYNIMKAAKESLQESEKIKNSFLANFNHEVRTPLNAIVGFSELMAETNNMERKKLYMDYIYINNEQLLRAISDILDLSRIDSGYDVKPERKDFSQCFEQLALSLKERNTNSEVEIEIINPFKKIIAEVDFPRIAQVITNFATNAMKFTPKGKITIGYSYDDGIMEVYVKDTGIGIPADKQHLVFERFQKVDPFSKGSGLGLSIVKALMSPFGVECGFESTYGEGSYFWARGPLVMTEIFVERDEDVEHVINTHTSSMATAPKNQTILIADDSDTNYFLLSQILGEENTLLRARNGQDAVLLNRKEKFDLILMDIRMPIMDGFKATTIIRRSDKTTPIIALSSNSLESDTHKALEVGCNVILDKPVRKKTLLNAIAEAQNDRNIIKE